MWILVFVMTIISDLPAFELKLKSWNKTKTIELTVLLSVCFQAGRRFHYTADTLGTRCQTDPDAKINNLTASFWPLQLPVRPQNNMSNIYPGSFTSRSKVL